MNNEFFQRDTDVARIAEGGIDNDIVPTAPNLKDAILEHALGPKKVTGDAGSVEQHSLPDQIAAERFIESKKASRKQGLGIKLTKLSPDGTT
jgi:hypothetical protein